VSHVAQPGHSGERQRPDKLAKRQFDVEVVEFGSSLRTLQ
jgi:hypothetical protein